MLDQPFTGDLDEQIKRRAIRVGVTYNRTHYFIDEGQERGLTYESLKNFEEALNTELKTGNLKVQRRGVADVARPALSGAGLRQGGHGRRHGDGDTRA